MVYQQPILAQSHSLCLEQGHQVLSSLNQRLNSGGVPSIACLTNPKRECKVCPSAMTQDGEKNFRYVS